MVVRSFEVDWHDEAATGNRRRYRLKGGRRLIGRPHETLLASRSSLSGSWLVVRLKLCFNFPLRPNLDANSTPRDFDMACSKNVRGRFVLVEQSSWMSKSALWEDVPVTFYVRSECSKLSRQPFTCSSTCAY